MNMRAPTPAGPPAAPVVSGDEPVQILLVDDQPSNLDALEAARAGAHKRRAATPDRRAPPHRGVAEAGQRRSRDAGDGTDRRARREQSPQGRVSRNAFARAAQSAVRAADRERSATPQGARQPGAAKSPGRISPPGTASHPLDER